MRKSIQLDRDFIQGFVGKQPKWGPVGYVTYKRTYARNIDADDEGLYSVPESLALLGRDNNLRGTEEFWLTLVRVVEGTFGIIEDHCRSLHLPWDSDRGQEMMQEMYQLMWDFKFTPPGRGLAMMGTDAVKMKGAACLNNCAFYSTDQIDADFSAPFCFLMDMSMLGVGVGGDTKGAGKVTISAPAVGPEHIVGDSREGWVGLLRRVLDSYVGKDTIPSSIDYSLVRLAGTKIRTFGGTASGPEPLKQLIIDICRVLDKRIGKKIRSSDIVDIFNLIGRCVIAGNVRRSAEIMFGDSDDISFLDLKDPEKNLTELMSHRWASNNSIWAQVGQDYTQAANRTAKNGEPGYMWLENARKYSRMIDPPDWKDKLAAGGNPCLEQTLESSELCCLVETYPANHESFEEFRRTLKYAYLYAKAVTLVSTHDQRTNAVLLRNRRIGTSMAGITQAIGKFGLRRFLSWCDRGYGYLTELDLEYSGWLCVPVSKKKTSVKPGGTVPLLPGATPGVHWPKSQFYYKVIRMATDSPFIPILRGAGYRCDEIDPKREPNTTACYFAVKEPYFQRSIKDVSMWEQLELAAQMQAYWADNQVSVTIEFDKETEGPQIKRALELYETRLKGVSFLPKVLDESSGYIHPPYQPISEEEYLQYTAGLREYDLNALKGEVEDRYCDSDRCEIPVKGNA